MRFGLYVHVPYCLQKCHYCDFTTFALNHEIKMAEYVQLLLTELRSRAKSVPEKILSSIYFGGGTPSLLPVESILAVMREIANVGFQLTPDCEVTIEINPGTVDQKKLDLYLAAGVNRFSVGVQTFNNDFLRSCGREHSADDSRELLRLFGENRVNFSFDLLFGLPQQSLADLEADLSELLTFSPPHVSLYNLTVPQSHKMNIGRAPDEVQAEMFASIDSHLARAGIRRYELSNFARPGFESRHNSLYWSDTGYWGIGVSAHSYLPQAGDWGTRFWNPLSAALYASQVRTEAASPENTPFFSRLPRGQNEPLQRHESLTDYCHTQLRVLRGLSRALMQKKYGSDLSRQVEIRAQKLVAQGLLESTPDGFCLSPKGLPLANQVFLGFTFLSEDINPR